MMKKPKRSDFGANVSLGRLERRTVLKGIGTTLVLPFLDAMTPMSAFAATGAGKKDPVRMLFVGLEGGIWTGEDGFFPCKDGINPERALEWGKKGILPGGAVADVGRNFQLTNTLEPLASVRDEITLLSGLHHRNDGIPNSVVNGHGQDLGTLLTAANISGTPGVALKNSISVDQLIARKVGDATRHPSLSLAVGRSSYNTKEATGLGYMGFLSYDELGYALPTEGDPGELFDWLFTDGSEKEQAQRDLLRRRKKSVLDAVLDDMKRVSSRVDSEDRSKLDEYFTTVREVEKRMERAKAWEDIPIELPAGTTRPEKLDRNLYGNDGSGRIEGMQQMLDVLVLAFQTDVTRVATMRLGGYHGKFNFLGFPEDPHGVYAHNGGDPERIKGAKAIDRMHMEQFAYLLDKMKGIREGNGTLLDNSLVMLGAGLTNGPSEKVRGGKVSHNAHGQVNTPIMIAGRGGGAVQPKGHLNFDHGTPLSNLYVTMMEAAGMPDAKFADSTGPLAGLS